MDLQDMRTAFPSTVFRVSLENISEEKKKVPVPHKS
jgi:hypothetical protein